MWEDDSPGYQDLSLPVQQKQKEKAGQAGYLGNEQPKRSEGMVVQARAKETERGRRARSGPR